MLRVLHFSDVHVDVPLRQMPVREMLSKRLLGAANLLLRRKRRFAKAREKLQALARFAESQRVDLVICTGDYTALGTVPELVAARRAIEPLTRRPRGFITVPGNHDLYLPDTLADGRFERIFGDLLGSDWPERAVDGHWPSIRLYDDCLAVVSVNSARPNPQLLRSSGRLPDAQLSALCELLADRRLDRRLVLIATHYAPRRRDGSPDRFSHGLENADELLAVCRRAPRAAILHGHIHWRYHVLPTGGPHLFGAGSATDAGREGIWLFEVGQDRARAVPGRFADGEYVLETSGEIVF
ncbi:MAG: metallophosphoesterase family protein [Polyangiales bacterium]